MRRRIDQQISQDEHPAFISCCTAHERAQASQQFVQRKRFDEVIICPTVKPLHPVFNSIPRRQHQNRRVNLPRAQGATDQNAIFVRQHNIQNDGIIAGCLGESFPFQAVESAIDRVTLVHQAQLQRLVQAVIVFDKQYAHGVSPLVPATGYIPQVCHKTEHSRKR
jgi:hypothetical protein